MIRVLVTLLFGCGNRRRGIPGTVAPATGAVDGYRRELDLGLGIASIAFTRDGGGGETLRGPADGPHR